MKLHNNYSFTHKRLIWRIIPGGDEKLVIEERDPGTREVFFNCINLSTGKVLLDSLQFEEKFWIGIEDIYKGIIFFHKYHKPDMPWHSDIIAYDISSKKELWKSDEYIFLLVYDDFLYCYKNKYEGRIYFKLNYKTGKLISELGEDSKIIAGLKELRDAEIYNGYTFPETLNYSKEEIATIFEEIKLKEVISGKIDYLRINDLLLTSYHRMMDDGKLQNCFKALDIRLKKVIFEEILNKDITNYIPDSFFLINDLVFLLKEKENLLVFFITD
ncbi:MAG: DUF4905 domain-containing protein [Ignavibacteriaceae bacterium]|nr:DUF4905 domain-containing protein [Ignavibacteriaceae bacterium]